MTFPDLSGALILFGAFAFFWINLIAYLAFRHDKHQSMTGGWRVSENALLVLALAGGWFGAKRAQRKFRHKTRKEPFRTHLDRIPFVWIVLVCLALVPGAQWPRFWAEGAMIRPV